MLTAKVPDLITVQGEKKNAAEVCMQTVLIAVQSEFRKYVNDQMHIFDSYLENRMMRQIEKDGFADVASWALDQSKQVCPNAIWGVSSSDNVLGKLATDGNTERSGPMTFGFVLYKQYCALYDLQKDCTLWATACHVHSFKAVNSFDDLLLELAKYKNLLEFSELLEANLDTRKLVEVIQENMPITERLLRISNEL